MISGSAFAVGRPLTAQELDQYKAAVSDAFSKQAFTCAHVKGLIMEDLSHEFLYAIQAANSGTLEVDGKQPLLVLTFDGIQISGKPFRTVATVFTSYDYKMLDSVHVQIFKTKNVNVGDIRNPNFQDRLILVQDATCTAGRYP